MFCTSCGSQQPDQAVFCSSCGARAQVSAPQAVQQPYAQPVYQQPQPAYGPTPKSKTSAVLLAVFLGVWAWLYTYKFDATKFWITFSVSFVLFFLNLVLPGIGFLGLGFYIWVIVDVANRSDDWYATYWVRPVQRY